MSPAFNLSTHLNGGNPLDPGIYIVTLYVIDDNNCEQTSDPVYLTVNNCDCITSVTTSSSHCLGVDINGFHYFDFEFRLHYNNTNNTFNPAAIMSLIPMQSTSATVTSITHVPNVDIFVTGTASYNANFGGQACFTFTYEDPADVRNNCTFNFCVQPGCRLEPYPWGFSITELTCVGTDGLGNGVYDFEIKTAPIGQVLNALYSVPASTGGIVNNLPPTLGAAATIATGQFIDIPPLDQTLCLQINVYDPVTFDYCFVSQCKILPQCNEEGRLDNPVLTSEDQNELHIYPNPASSEVEFNYNLMESSGKLQLLSFTGQPVFNQQIHSTTGHIKFDGSHLNPGIYIVHLTTANATLTQKLLIIR